MTGCNRRFDLASPLVMCALLLLTAARCANLGQQASPTDRPNVLWITSEDNSPLIGAYGDDYADTPNNDRLAKRGVLYENAYATMPVCAPSRFTLITGTYVNRMGTENMRSTYPIPEEIRFYPKYFQDAGYHTTNNQKKDYNTVDQPEVWDESSGGVHFRDREEGQPFFHCWASTMCVANCTCFGFLIGIFYLFQKHCNGLPGHAGWYTET